LPAPRVGTLLVAAGGLAAAGIVLLAIGRRVGGFSLLAVGIVLAVVAGLRRRSGGSDRGRAEQVRVQAQLELRERDEQRAEQDQRKREHAERQILEAAAACRCATTTAEAAIEMLRGWQHDRREQVERYEADQARRAELKALLGDRNLRQLQDD